MAEPKTRCSQCGAEILLATAERNGGLCMPCKQRANPPRFEVTPQDEERFRKNDEILRRLLEGCSEEEFTKLRCPACGSVLTLHVHPNLRAFAVRCSVSTLHLMRHDKISKPPAWWNNRVGGEWLDDVSPQPAGAQPQRGADGSQAFSSSSSRTSAAAGSRGSR